MAMVASGPHIPACAMPMSAEGRRNIQIGVSGCISAEYQKIEIALSKQLSTSLLASQGELAHRVSRMRRAFAKQYGFVVPDIRVADDLSIPAKTYQIKIHGTVVASEELRIGDVLVAARAAIAYYDDRLADKKSQRMIGQHGSLTDQERIVPLIRLGAFAAP